VDSLRFTEERWAGVGSEEPTLRKRGAKDGAPASFCRHGINAESVVGEVVGGGGLIATEDGRSEILFAGFGPFDHGEARGVIDNATVADGHASGNVGVAIHARPTTIDKAKFTVIYLKNGDVGVFANRKRAQFRAMNFVSGIDGGPLDEVGERYPHGSEFRKDIIVAEDRVILDVQIGGDGIGYEPLFDSGDGVAEPEAAGTVAHIEKYAALAGFEHDGIDLAIGKNNRELLREHVGVNVTRTGFFEDEVGIRAIRTRPEIVHHGAISGCGALDGTVYSDPGLMLGVPRLVGPVVRGFYTDDKIRIFVDGIGAAFDVHLVNILLEAAAHAIGHDVEKSEDAGLGVLHDHFLFGQEGFGAGGASVNDSGYTRSEGEIRGNGVGLDVRTSRGIEPVERRTTRGDVNVNVDQAGSYIETTGIDDFFGRGGGNVLFNGGDFASGDGDVHDTVNVVGGVDDVAAFEEEFVAGSLGSSSGNENKKREGGSKGEQRSCEKIHTGPFLFFPERRSGAGERAELGIAGTK
jgi:hypothetical protein